jgi:hypothetical protein
MRKRMFQNKKAISPIISYALLIGISISVSVLIYQWVSSYTPRETSECPNGVSLIVSSYDYDSTADTLDFTLRNRGRFNLDGYFIRASENVGDLPTIDLSSDLTSGQGESEGGYVQFTTGLNLDSLKPGEGKTFGFTLNQDIKTIQIIPLRQEVVDNVKRLATCNKASILQRIDEGEHFVLGGGEGGGGGENETVLSLSLALDGDPFIDSSTYTYPHTKTFTESGGVGVTLNQRQVCILQPSESCTTTSVNHIVSANDDLVLNEAHGTQLSHQVFRIRYFKEGDSNPIVTQFLCVRELDAYPNQESC